MRLRAIRRGASHSAFFEEKKRDFMFDVTTLPAGSSDSVIVVGYPKSGNKWLTALLADALRLPVRPAGNLSMAQLAAQVNNSLHLDPSQPSPQGAKYHLLPDQLLREIKTKPKYLVYLYRDVRFVVIASFCYLSRLSHFAGHSNDIKRRSPGQLLLNPIGALRYLRHRHLFARFLRKFMEGAFRGDMAPRSTWMEHIQAWQTWARKHPETQVAFVAYEELLDDTENQLARIIGQMGLPVPDMNHLAGSVERQSFKTQKLLRQSLAEKIKQLDKDGNVAFARRGLSNEWKNFLTRDMAREINTYAGSLLLDLGYEQDPNWIAKFE